jgi:hypothetical protein
MRNEHEKGETVTDVVAALRSVTVAAAARTV